GDLSGVAAVVVVVIRLGPDDGLHREPGVDQVAIGGDVQVLEAIHQRGAVVPVHVRRASDDVVALQRRDRDDLDVRECQLGGKGGELRVDAVVDILAVVDQVHLVDGDDQVRHTQHGQQHRVAPRLLGQTLAGIDEYQAEVGGRGAGDHVAGVLDVPGGIGDD